MADDLRSARVRLGLSRLQIATALGLAGNNPARSIHAMEIGHKTISGPVSAAVTLMLAVHDAIAALSRGDQLLSSRELAAFAILQAAVKPKKGGN